MINLELPWNPAVLEQRIGRIYRIGQDKPIDVFNLVCEQGIESRIAALVGSKQAFFKGLFDGESDAIQFEQSSSFLQRVETLYDLSHRSTGNDKETMEAAESDADDLALDDSVTDPFEEMIEAGDESHDGPSSVLATTPEREAEPNEPVRPSKAVSLEPSDIGRLFSQLQIRRGDEGKVIIEAPGEVAATLGALFEGMAAMLGAAARNDE